MGSFSEADFEQKLLYLKDSHESITKLSSWCLRKHEHHAKIVSTWLNVLKGVKIENRLILFYLANDVILNSKFMSLAFVDAFAPVLQKATIMVREDSVRNKILHLFKIWDEHGIYDKGFLVGLSSLLSRDHKNANGIDLPDFQPSVIQYKIKNLKELEEEADLRLKLLNDSSHGDAVISDFDEGLKHLKAYIDALEAEIKERHGLIDFLEVGEQHYAKEFKEAKFVVNAYKCYTTKVQGVKRKLKEKIESMTRLVTPPPQSPSPQPTDVLENVDMEISVDEELDSILNEPINLPQISVPRRSDILNIPVQYSRSYQFGKHSGGEVSYGWDDEGGSKNYNQQDQEWRIATTT